MDSEFAGDATAALRAATTAGTINLFIGTHPSRQIGSEQFLRPPDKPNRASRHRAEEQMSPQQRTATGATGPIWRQQPQTVVPKGNAHTMTDRHGKQVIEWLKKITDQLAQLTFLFQTVHDR